MKPKSLLLVVLLIITSFSTATLAAKSTDDIAPVSPFDVNRYLGKWYEIARLPNFFESGLDYITATYSLRPDGKVSVLNQGIKKSGQPSKITGTATIINAAVPARLRVSFFLWFGSDYLIFDLDQTNYDYAMVTSANRGYLWILSRRPQMDDTLYSTLVAKAAALGFETAQLIKVKQPAN